MKERKTSERVSLEWRTFYDQSSSLLVKKTKQMKEEAEEEKRQERFTQ
jgi:hypothetical protein